MDLSSLANDLEERYPEQPEFVQAARGALRELEPFLQENERFRDESLLRRLLEPDRLIQFRVDWEDDEGKTRVQRGYRVQWNDALGPYKGGIRFHPSVSPSILKFLAFEQTFKNALTGLALGGAKGGADLDPKGCSEREIRRFCRAFALELQRHVGREHDVPAGDIGVGSREIGFLYGQYKRLDPEAAEAITGKPLALGGSSLREEATGWGVVYFAASALEHHDRSLEGLTCAVSGAGNVALHTAQKLIEKDAKVVTLSDAGGFVHCPDGFSAENLQRLGTMKRDRGSVKEFAEKSQLEYREGKAWQVPCEAAFPCATQNELEESDAKQLLGNGCEFVCEGANMPCTSEAEALFQEAGILFAPGKAANAGGVAVSEFEMAQAAARQSWSREEVDGKLAYVMKGIHERCVEYGTGDRERVDYAAGATRAAFARVADAMLRL